MMSYHIYTLIYNAGVYVTKYNDWFCWLCKVKHFLGLGYKDDVNVFSDVEKINLSKQIVNLIQGVSLILSVLILFLLQGKEKYIFLYILNYQ